MVASRREKTRSDAGKASYGGPTHSLDIFRPYRVRLKYFLGLSDDLSVHASYPSYTYHNRYIHISLLFIPRTRPTDLSNVQDMVTCSKFLALVDEFLAICAESSPANPASLGDVMTTIETAAKHVGLDLVDPKTVPENANTPRFHPTEWYFLSTGETRKNAWDDHRNHPIDPEQSSFDIVLRRGRFVADLFTYVYPGSRGRRLEWCVGVFSWLHADDLTEISSYNDYYEVGTYHVGEHSGGLSSWLSGTPTPNEAIMIPS